MISEQAYWFGPSEGLLGVISVPPPGVTARGLGVGLMNAGNLLRVGGARLNVRLARNLAALGFPSIRFDLSGLGDSEPRPDPRPYLESMATDVEHALHCLSSQTGVKRFALIGHCSGAAVAYVASLSNAHVVSLVQIEGLAYPTRRYQYFRWRRILMNSSNWRELLTGKKNLQAVLGNQIASLLARPNAATVQPPAESLDTIRQNIRNLVDLRPSREQMQAGLSQLVSRRVRMLNIFAGGDHHYYSYREQFADAFPGLDFRGLLELEHVTDANHYFSAQRHQAWLDQRIATTIQRVADDLAAATGQPALQ
jgi:pimeloyl-ACP methyl ester carboxylesterase